MQNPEKQINNREKLKTPEQFSQLCLELFKNRLAVWQRQNLQHEIDGVLIPTFDDRGKLYSLESVLANPEINYISQAEKYGSIHNYIFMEFILFYDIEKKRVLEGFTGPAGFPNLLIKFQQNLNTYLKIILNPMDKSIKLFNTADRYDASKAVEKLLRSITDEVLNFKHRYQIEQIFSYQETPYE